MDEDEEKLNALHKKMKFEEDPSFLDHLKALWYVNRVIAKKQRTLNAIKWFRFQHTLLLRLKAFYIVHVVGMPAERDKERAGKAKHTADD